MSSANPGNDASDTPPSTPNKETGHSPTLGGNAMTPTAKAADSANATELQATPKSSTSDSARFTTSTTPSAQPGAIAAWGSTSGKLFLSDPRLNDGDSTSTLWEYCLKLGFKNVTENKIAEKAEQAKKAKEDEDKAKAKDRDKEPEVD